MGWLSGWGYRKSHVINAAAGAGDHYQVAIKVWKSASTIYTKTPKANMTYERQYAQQGVIGGKIYVVGGRTGTSRVDYNEEYNPATNTWATKTAFPRTQDAAGCGVLVDADAVTRFHVVGGYPPVAHNHYAYDPIADTWTEYAAFPSDYEWDCGGIVINNKLYIFGGSSDGNVKDIIYVYDPATDAWTQKTSMTYGRAKHGFCAHNGKIYVFSSNWSTLHTHTEVYDPVGDSWTTLSDAPERVHCATKESISGKIYLHTYVDKNYVYEYDIATDSYIKLYGSVWGYSLPLESVVIGTKFYTIGGDNGTSGEKSCWEESLTLGSGDGTEAIEGTTAGKVYVNARCRDDFGDIRFTDDDGTTLLDYWMESYISGIFAIFWVEVADSLTTDPQTIYVYYDKASDTTTSNGANTFPLFFDHFDDADYTDKWTAGGTGIVAITESGTVITLQATGNWKNAYILSKSVFGLNTRNVFYAKFYSNKNEESGEAGYSDLAKAHDVFRYNYSGQPYFTHHTWNGGSHTYLNNALARDSNYHRFFAMRITNVSAKFQIDNGIVMQITTNIPTANLNIWAQAGSYATSTAPQVEVDYALVMKFVDPEPAHSTWGTEEGGFTEHYVSVTELLGCLDSYSRTKSYFRIITEKLGVKDTRSRSKTINRIVTELLGLKDSRSRKKTISRVITELIGVKDAVTKVAWHWSLPPIPPVITAAVGKIKQILLDKFLGWLEQPAEDNPRVQCDVEVSWTQTNRVASSIKDFFTETVTIKAKVAHVFTETMPITAALLHEFIESVQIRSGIIQKFEETRNITADLMKAVIEDGLKVFGEVTPLLEKLRELKRRIEEN